MSNRVELTWAGGRHPFALNLGEIRRLQESCQAGPEEVFNRLRAGNWKLDDVIEPLRLGLIGSGAMTEAEAGPLIHKLLQQGNPLVDFKLWATAVMMAAIMGVDGDPLEQAPTGETPAPAATGE